MILTNMGISVSSDLGECEYDWAGPGVNSPAGHVSAERISEHIAAVAGSIVDDKEAMQAIAGLQARGYRAEQVRAAWRLIGTCRVCGCTDNDCSPCMEATGRACSWANGSNTLCTRCDLSARGGR